LIHEIILPKPTPEAVFQFILYWYTAIALASHLYKHLAFNSFFIDTEVNQQSRVCFKNPLFQFILYWYLRIESCSMPVLETFNSFFIDTCPITASYLPKCLSFNSFFIDTLA
jgi:hypothetical protein